MGGEDPRVLEQTVVPSERKLVEQWLEQLEAGLRSESQACLASLFAPESHWRDLLAFTWSITPCQGAEHIAAALAAKQATAKAHGFAIAEARMPPRRAQRAGIDVVEGIFQFETGIGRGHGVVRLLAAEPSKAFQLMTGLHELKGFEEKIGKRRPTGEAYSRNFGGTNWKDQRGASQAYADREPAVLVVGGGQAGLTVAATLGLLGVDTLVVDRHERVGDCWRKRYHSLALHNSTDVNHLPYIPFPPSWPVYLPKDMIADWFETYAWAMEINFWTGTELTSGTYDESTGTWQAVLRKADGSERTLRPRHLIFANGLVGFPRIPEFPGLKDFEGDVMHTAEFTNGANWRGKKALVLGTGTSGHDVAQDLHCNGVETTIVQRGSTTVVSIDPSAKLTYGIYEGIALEDGDLLVSTNTLPITRLNLQRLTARMVELDRKMIDGLLARGFKWDIGEDEAGHQMKIRTRYGGYYLDAGCAQLIIDGEIGLLQFDQIERFVADGALLKDGSVKPADLLVLATGFETQEVLVGKLLGDGVAKKVGPVWGIGPDGEMNNMWKRTAQAGLWFVGGSFANCRIYSRYVALQIKAIEEGLLAQSGHVPDPRQDRAAGAVSVGADTRGGSSRVRHEVETPDRPDSADGPLAVLQRLDTEAQRTESPCGDGSMVWRSWGDGPALILLHGGAGSWQHWVRTVPAFRPTRRVLAPDLPGLGESADPPEPADMQTIAAIVAAGIDALLGTQASYDLVGFSFGASVGGHVALLHGQRVRSLTLLGAGGLVRPRTPIVLERVRDKTGDALMQAHRTNLGRSMIGDPARIDDLAVAIQDWNARRSRLNTPALIAQRPLAVSLPQLRIPVNAIWGERDQLAYYTLEDRIAALRVLRPDVEPRIIPSAGHWAPYELPDQFNATLAELLRATRRLG